MKRLTSRCKPG